MFNPKVEGSIPSRPMPEGRFQDIKPSPTPPSGALASKSSQVGEPPPPRRQVPLRPGRPGEGGRLAHSGGTTGARAGLRGAHGARGPAPRARPRGSAGRGGAALGPSGAGGGRARGPPPRGLSAARRVGSGRASAKAAGMRRGQQSGDAEEGGRVAPRRKERQAVGIADDHLEEPQGRTAGSCSIGTPRAARRSARPPGRAPGGRGGPPPTRARPTSPDFKESATEEEDDPPPAPLAPLAVDGQPECLLVEANRALEVAGETRARGSRAPPSERA